MFCVLSSNTFARGHSKMNTLTDLNGNRIQSTPNMA